MASTILIVDDSRPIRELIRMTLGDTFVVVGECEDGSEALDAYVRLRPAWVLMDVDMLEIDGITATRQIITIFPDAKIVILTEHDDAALRRAALEAGAERYVLKQNLLSLCEIIET